MYELITKAHELGIHFTFDGPANETRTNCSIRLFKHFGYDELWCILTFDLADINKPVLEQTVIELMLGLDNYDCKIIKLNIPKED